jgi:disulfide bond formation protein DsbB
LVFKKYERIYILVLSLVFFTAALISFYHFGIEQGFFSESLVCNLKNNENLTKDQLLKQLEGSSVISCKDVTFRVLGLSLATINTIISIILSVIMFKLVKNYEQNK